MLEGMDLESYRQMAPRAYQAVRHFCSLTTSIGRNGLER